ncbi:MAG TPA: TIGR00725 family protein [Thermoanaerobaculia bacterium]|nr:TIGR00725 family protein [Thermoanaerobaculia bacterium]
MLRRPIVGVMGGGAADAATCELARELGRRLAREGALLLCGGRGGVMTAAARGAHEAGGRVIGVLPYAPGEGGPNPYVDCALYTGLGDGRNYVNARSSDVLIALRGGPGTLSEIALAWKLGVPVVLLAAWDFLAGQPALGLTPTAHVQSPAEAVAAACRFIGFTAGAPFDRPLAYPAMPDQSALRQQLLRFLAADGQPP